MPVRSRLIPTIAALAVLAVGASAAGAAGQIDTITGGATATAPAVRERFPATTTSTVASTTTTVAPSTTLPGPAAALARLTVAPLDTAAYNAYNTADWPFPRDVDRDGCDAAEQAYVTQSEIAATTDSACTVLAGRWTSPYDGKVHLVRTAMEIDHIVPKHLAAAQGGAGWTAAQRLAFANDQRNLWAVTGVENSSKGDSSPDVWRPGKCTRAVVGWCTPETTVIFRAVQYTNRAWCEFAVRWVTVKDVYRLSVTAAEKTALEQMLAVC